MLIQDDGYIFAISANGGHLTEMKLALSAFRGDVFWITFDGSDSKDLDGMLLTDYHNRLLKFFTVSMSAVKFFYLHRPKTIISTGGLIALPFAFISWVLGVKFIFFECGTRIRDVSKTAKLIAILHREIYVQSESLCALNPKRYKYIGSIL